MSDVEVIETAAGAARLRRSRRKTLAISVLPDGRLELTAPRKAVLRDILKKLTKRVAWIARQRRGFKTMGAVRPPRRYVSGATHRYLGRQYVLRVKRGTTASVALRGGTLHVTVPSIDEAAVRKALDAWYRRHAREQFAERLERWEEWCVARRLPVPRLRLLSMPKRWGSALRDGTICLNPELVRAPSICVDYVIIHEICHLKEHSHGARFFRLLSQLLPDWQKRKARLESCEL